MSRKISDIRVVEILYDNETRTDPEFYNMIDASIRNYKAQGFKCIENMIIPRQDLTNAIIGYSQKMILALHQEEGKCQPAT